MNTYKIHNGVAQASGYDARITGSLEWAALALTDISTLADDVPAYLERVRYYERIAWLPSSLALTLLLIYAGYENEPWPEVLEQLEAWGVAVTHSAEPAPELLEIIEQGHLEYSLVMGVNRG